MRGCQKGLIRDIVGGGEDERLSEGFDQGYSLGRGGGVVMTRGQKGLIRDIVVGGGGVMTRGCQKGLIMGYSWGR